MSATDLMHEFKKDKDFNPTGGLTKGLGISIQWQDGPLKKDGKVTPPNGAFVEKVIESAIARLEFFQDSKFRCGENSYAIRDLRAALSWLRARATDREGRKVKGTHKV